MNFSNVIKHHINYAFIACVLIVGGCSSPPSVVPLLRVSQDTLMQEADRLHDDVTRDARAVEQTRQTLADAYAADLRTRGELDPSWVLEATIVYVAAREALAFHEMNLRQERIQRAANLELAAQATGRAVELIEQRDRLLTDRKVWELWQIFNDSK